MFMESLTISPFGIRRVYNLLQLRIGSAEKTITGGREILFPTRLQRQLYNPAFGIVYFQR